VNNGSLPSRACIAIEFSYACRTRRNSTLPRFSTNKTKAGPVYGKSTSGGAERAAGDIPTV